MPDYSSIGQRFNQPLGTGNGALAERGRMIGSDAQAMKELAYKAFVVCHEQDILVEAWLPEQVGNDVNANYEPPFAQGIGGDGQVANALKLAGLSLTTQALTVQVWQGGSYINFSLTFIFQAENSGKDDVMTPIKNLMRLMMPKESSPGGLLRAPGPHLDPKKSLTNATVNKIVSSGADALTDLGNAVTGLFKSGSGINGQGFGTQVSNAADKLAQPISSAIVNSVTNNISLYLGQFQYFPSVVVTDVSPTFDVVLGPDNNPVRASVVVAFRTYYVPTENDLELMFPSATSGRPTGGSGGSGGGDRGNRGGF